MALKKFASDPRIKRVWMPLVNTAGSIIRKWKLQPTNTASKKACLKALSVKIEMTYERSHKEDRFKGNYCRVPENGAQVSHILSFKQHWTGQDK